MTSVSKRNNADSFTWDDYYPKTYTYKQSDEFRRLSEIIREASKVKQEKK